MPIPLDAGLPPGLELSGSYTVRFTAVDPVTGAVDTSVVISGATVQYEDISAATTGGEIIVPDPVVVPVQS